MSDQGENTSAPTPGAEDQIPKYRLNEEIQEKNRLRGEVESLRALVGKLAPQPTKSPEVEDPAMAELKESNPVLYKKLKSNEMSSRRTSAQLFGVQEQLDKNAFIAQAGVDEANKFGHEVERILESERQRGNFSQNRMQLYVLLKGDQALKNERQAKVQKPKPVETQSNTEVEAPPSDPKAQGVSGSAATTSSEGPSIEELEKRLANVEF